MKVEKLALARTYQPAVRSAKVGRVWIKVASGRRRAVAERIAQGGGFGPRLCENALSGLIRAL